MNSPRVLVPLIVAFILDLWAELGSMSDRERKNLEFVIPVERSPALGGAANNGTVVTQTVFVHTVTKMVKYDKSCCETLSVTHVLVQRNCHARKIHPHTPVHCSRAST